MITYIIVWIIIGMFVSGMMMKMTPKARHLWYVDIVAGIIAMTFWPYFFGIVVAAIIIGLAERRDEK